MTIFFRISIHEVFANLDESIRAHKSLPLISIHEVFANLDAYGDLITVPPFSFQSTRSSQTSTTISDILTPVRWNFNPRGLRKPRPVRVKPDIAAPRFQSTRSSQTSTQQGQPLSQSLRISIHEVFANLDVKLRHKDDIVAISIHEVFANLDAYTMYYQFHNQISIHEVFANLDITMVF